MRTDAPSDVPTHLLSQPDAYITHIGKVLRRTSLDELPQLFNILKGDMSIAAPRPALWNQYDLIAERDKYAGRYGLTVNQIRPGLTGWAQVNGRDELPIAQKARFDGEYMEKIGVLIDIKIFLLTVINVFTKRGVREGAVNETSVNCG
jgi:O-antigen biosynthesis protein WbqP